MTLDRFECTFILTMTNTPMTARYASTCQTCKGPIAVGTQILWAKGSPARHVTCGAATKAPRATSGKRYYTAAGEMSAAEAKRFMRGDGVRGCQVCRDMGRMCSTCAVDA